MTRGTTVTLSSIRRATPLVGIASLALVLAACGGDSDSDADRAKGNSWFDDGG